MNKSTKKIKNQLTKLKNIRIILIVIVILLSTTLIYNLITTPKGNENITTKLNNDTDFLNWFIDFDNLYKKNIPTIDYSLNKDMFTKINNYLEGNNQNNIYYKDNTYYIDEYDTIELDVYTRSLRHTKYDKEKNKIEILEINLKNGKYYIQLINTKNIYKITLNNKIVKKNKTKLKGKVETSESIYSIKDFNW